MVFTKLTLAVVASVIVLSTRTAIGAVLGDRNRDANSPGEAQDGNNYLLNVPADVLRSVESEIEDLTAMLQQWRYGGANDIDNSRSCSLAGSACGYPFQDPCCAGLACLHRGFYSECIAEINTDLDTAETIAKSAQDDLATAREAMVVANGLEGQSRDAPSTGRLDFNVRAQKRRRKTRESEVQSVFDGQRDSRYATAEENPGNMNLHVQQKHAANRQE